MSRGGAQDVPGASGGPASRAARVRRAAGWFPDLARGVVEVTGRDRVRWLNGMITADVTTLGGGEGAYSLLLSPKGRILADLHLMDRGEAFWLDTDADRLEALIAQLERYVIADDVTLRDLRPEQARAALEGPDAEALLTRLLGEARAIAPEAAVDAEIAGVPVSIASWGDSGEQAFQLFLPRGQRAAIDAAVRAEGGAGLVCGDAATLEVLRIEAGVPRMGAELDDEVLPAEAGLVERAISLTKGCFTGQEIVARLESRGQVRHLLVGLRFEAGAPPAGRPLTLPDGKVVGEVTSACVSSLGAIGLGFTRREHAAPGTRLRVDGATARVVELPFAPSRAS